MVKIDVAIPKTRFDMLTYDAPDTVGVGDLVQVPLRDAEKYGIVIRTYSSRKVKHIKKIHDIIEHQFLPSPLIQLYSWIADYYLAHMGEVLRLAIPQKILRRHEPTLQRAEPLVVREPLIPNPAQAAAIQDIQAALKQRTYGTFLLYGITGSGKTEVYLQCTDNVLARGGRVLVLVPEISMTPLLFDRFKERFSGRVITIHSSLNQTQRRNVWYAIKRGEYDVIIGPRSAVFIPVPGLELVIVDEEHDHSYKEHERAPRYHARDVAVMRARLENIVAVLGSATPQIESYHNAMAGKYRLHTLDQRIDAKALPGIQMIDLRKEKGYLSPRLERSIQEVVERNEQVILFLNRRGFAPHLMCPSCGFVAKCPYCGLPLVYHKPEQKRRASLSCHICKYKREKISICPQCSRTTLLYRGAGTQRIEEIATRIVQRVNPTAAVVRLDRDIARKKGRTETVLSAFQQGEACVLLGTQLVTKGFHFPGVTLVGVVNADLMLHLPDFRSSERTFQLITQVAGRSGRGERPGTVLIQTYHPDQYAIMCSQLQDYPKFYAEEVPVRRELRFPPFSRLILLRIKGTNEDSVWREARSIAAKLRPLSGVQIFGPNRSLYYRVRKYHRVFILLKVARTYRHSRLRFLLSHRAKGCALEIDVDPLETF
ncbi:MAG: primosomal protein N' [candidate division WOR-3 bacterium]|nr:MAG: primosomal protein N' [candidate division WOR-3 bacterium]